MVKFKKIIYKVGGWVRHFDTYHEFCKWNLDTLPEGDKPFFADYLARARLAEELFEQNYNLPPGSLEGLIIALKEPINTVIRLQSPLFRKMITDESNLIFLTIRKNEAKNHLTILIPRESN